MGIYDSIGMQKEYNIINEHLGVKEINPFEDKDAFKNSISLGLDNCIEKDTKMSYLVLKVTSELVYFYLDVISSEGVEFDDVWNIFLDNQYQLLKSNKEIIFQSISLDRKIENFKDEIDKEDIITSCKKRYQDLVESSGEKISLLMKISNVAEVKYTFNDINGRIFDKINALKRESELPFIRESINRFIRNKIGHFDFCYDNVNNCFKGINGNFICSLKDFIEYNIDIAAIEYGFFNSINILTLLIIQEVEFAKEYMEKIEQYLFMKVSD